MHKILTALALGLLVLNVALAADDKGQNDKTADQLIALHGTIQSINEELSSQRAQIGSMRSDINNIDADAAAFRRTVLDELKALRRQNQSLVDSLFAGGQTDGAAGKVSTVTPLRNYDMQTPDGKMFFGQTEFIYVKEANATFEARIDSGAAVSSISAVNITEFERNGKKWFRFHMQANDRDLEMEAPFVRYSDIRQSTKDTLTRRPVVSLNLKIGDFSTASEFTLADRTHMQFPLLIGRTMLQDVAVVDVARSNIQKRADPNGLVILDRDEYNKLKKDGVNPNAAYDERQKNTARQIAYPSNAYGTNLGTDSNLALPQAVKEREQDPGTVTAQPASKATENKAKVKDKDQDK